MPTDDLDAWRWFRDRLKALGAQYPELKTPKSQERLDAELAQQERAQQAEEDTQRGEAG